MLHKPLSISQGAFLALAVMAAALLLLRPVCDLWFAHAGTGAAPAHTETFAAGAPVEHGSAPAAQCCASASDGKLVAPLQAAPGGPTVSQGFAATALVAVVTGTAALVRELHWLRAPPRNPQSFYLRSTRIAR